MEMLIFCQHKIGTRHFVIFKRVIIKNNTKTTNDQNNISKQTKFKILYNIFYCSTDFKPNQYNKVSVATH